MIKLKDKCEMARYEYSRLEHLKQLLRIELASDDPGLLYIEDLQLSIEKCEVSKQKLDFHLGYDK